MHHHHQRCRVRCEGRRAPGLHTKLSTPFAPAGPSSGPGELGGRRGGRGRAELLIPSMLPAAPGPDGEERVKLHLFPPFKGKGQQCSVQVPALAGRARCPSPCPPALGGLRRPLRWESPGWDVPMQQGWMGQLRAWCDAPLGVSLHDRMCPNAGVTSVLLCGAGEQGCQLPGTQSDGGAAMGSILSPLL